MESIAVDLAALLDVCQNGVHENFALYLGDNLGADLASASVDHSEDDGLLGGSGAPGFEFPAGLSLHKLGIRITANAQVLILGQTADVCLIDLNGSAFSPAHLIEGPSLHSQPNSMQHEPCGLLSDAKRPMHLIARNAVL